MNENIIEKAQELESSGKVEEAIKLLIPLVESGNIIAKANLGFMYCFNCYENGKFLKFEMGQELLEESCEAGEASACHNLGTLWLGQSPLLENDPKKAAYYYLKARELGGAIATKDFYKQWEEIQNG